MRQNRAVINQRGAGGVPHRRAAGRRPAGWAALSSALFSVAVIVSVLMTVAAPAPASAPAGAPEQAALVPAGAVTTSIGPIALIVDPATDLDPAGGTINVSGSGFNGAETLVVAVCADDGQAPNSLDNCVGGSIPGANTGQAWALISADGTNSQGNDPVLAKWGPGGSFQVALNVPTSGTLNCSVTACKLFTRYVSSNAQGNVSVPLTYSGVASSSASSSVTFSSISQPKEVTALASSASVVQGGTQKIIFPGFRANETVEVTLNPKATKLPPVQASEDGVVTIQFQLSKTLSVGPHYVFAVGEESKTFGQAYFLVTALPTTPRSTPTTKTTASSTPSSAAASSSVASSSAAVSSVPVSSPASSSAQSSVLAPTSSSGGGSTGSGRPIWPWVVLGGVIVLWIIAAIVFWVLRRRRIAAENERRDQQLAEAAAEQELRNSPMTNRPMGAPDLMEDILGPGQIRPDGPESTEQPPGYERDEFGLLSGREEPGHQALILGQSGHTAPTHRILAQQAPVAGPPNAPTAGPPGLPPVPAAPPSGGAPVAGQPGSQRPGQPYGGPQRPMAARPDATVNLGTAPPADPTVSLASPAGRPYPAPSGAGTSDLGPTGNLGSKDNVGPTGNVGSTAGVVAGADDDDGDGQPRRRRYRDDDEQPSFGPTAEPESSAPENAEPENAEPENAEPEISGPIPEPSPESGPGEPPFDTGPQTGRHSR